MKKFIFTSGITLILIIGASLILKQFINKNLEITPVYFTAPFVMLVTIIFHAFLIKAASKEPKSFINLFLASTGIKLMVYLLLNVIYIISVPLHAKPFIVSFLISYFIYSSIEISAILNFLKK